MRAAGLIFAVVISLMGLQAFAQAPSPWARGARLAQEGNCDGVVQALTPAVASSRPPTADPYVWLSDCQAEMNRLTDAEKTLRKGLTAFPANPLLEMALGELLMDAQPDSQEAGKLLEHSVRIAPREPGARHSYARWAQMNLRHRICITQEKAGILLPGIDDTTLLKMNTLLAICSGQVEETAEAWAAFRRANAINLRQKTYEPEVAWLYAQFLRRFGGDAELQALVGEILEHAPGFAPARLERAKYFDREGQPDKAVEAAQLALQNAGSDSSVERGAHEILARSFSKLNQADNASREQAWLDAHPETPVK